MLGVWVEIKPATFYLASGLVFCWGSNQHGQCGRPLQRLSKDHDQQVFTTPQLIRGLLSNVRVTQLKTGWSHLLAITGKKVARSDGDSCHHTLILSSSHANFNKICASHVHLATCNNQGIFFGQFVHHIVFHLVGYHALHSNFCPHHVSHKNTLPNSGNFCCLVAYTVVSHRVKTLL